MDQRENVTFAVIDAIQKDTMSMDDNLWAPHT